MNHLYKRHIRKKSPAHRRESKHRTMRRRLLKKRGDICENCGARNTQADLHHIVRAVDGGSYKEHNLVFLCRGGCHQEADKVSRELGGVMKTQGLSELQAVCRWYEAYFGGHDVKTGAN